MTLEEQKQIAIDYYVNLMRIKAHETGENKELDYQIKGVISKLSSMGVNVEDITL